MLFRSCWPTLSQIIPVSLLDPETFQQRNTTVRFRSALFIVINDFCLEVEGAVENFFLKLLPLSPSFSSSFSSSSNGEEAHWASGLRIKLSLISQYSFSISIRKTAFQGHLFFLMVFGLPLYSWIGFIPSKILSCTLKFRTASLPFCMKFVLCKGISAVSVMGMRKCGCGKGVKPSLFTDALGNLVCQQLFGLSAAL